MAAKKERLKEWLRLLLRKQIADVRLAVFVAKNETRQPEPLEIAILVEGNQSGKIVLSSDGESLEFKNENLMSADLDSLGAVEIKDSITGLDSHRVVDFEVLTADLITNEGVAVGMKLGLSNGSSLFVLNGGDRMFVMMDGNHPLLHEDGTTLEPVI